MSCSSIHTKANFEKHIIITTIIIHFLVVHCRNTSFPKKEKKIGKHIVYFFTNACRVVASETFVTMMIVSVKKLRTYTTTGKMMMMKNDIVWISYASISSTRQNFFIFTKYSRATPLLPIVEHSIHCASYSQYTFTNYTMNDTLYLIISEDCIIIIFLMRMQA